MIRDSSDASNAQGKSAELEQSLDVELSESGPERLEYYFDYVSENERRLVMAWGGATVPISITAHQPMTTQ